MRKLITIEGIGDTSEIAKLLSEKLNGKLFSNMPSNLEVSDMTPYMIQQMLAAYACSQLGVKDSFTVMNKGYRSLFLKREQSNLANLNYKNCEGYIEILGTKKVEKYHIFIISPQLGYEAQVTQIQKCKEALGGGKYIIISPTNYTNTERIVEFIIEEVI